MLKRLFAPVLTLLLIIFLVGAIYKNIQERTPTLHEIKGVIGSEKNEFFDDPKVIEALANDSWKLKVTVEKMGSREMANEANLKTKYDFAFPAGVASAEKIKHTQNSNQVEQVFFTPMVIASWKPIADILMANNIVTKRGNTHYVVNMMALFDLIIKEKRWTDLKGSDLYPANKTISVTTTNIKTSNSAAMYLALASYILNNNKIVQNEEQINSIVAPLKSLFQGFLENSTETVFQDYLTMGMGKSPLVMIYEAQFLREVNKKSKAINDEMVLLYPEPTLFTKHLIIPFNENENANKLVQALIKDETLQQIATQYGFRTANNTNNSALPNLVNVIDEPSYDLLETIINKITAK